jgi:all-trans-8'-apo-beta-carotenal 15,15'-oxygenase
VWTGIFAPLHAEHDYEVEEIDGRLPDELVGTLYRNGPGKWEAGGRPLGHIFDGDGMLSMFVLQDGGVSFRNRYVRTSHYLAGLESKGAPMRGVGTMKPGGILANAFRVPANVANTNVVLHAGRLLALWEGGKPHALDPDTLATTGVHDFDGELRWLGAFSAHPHFDPASGEMFNFGLDFLPRPMIRCYRIDPCGRMEQFTQVHIPELVWTHDFGLTDRHMVFVLDPIVVDVVRVGLGLTTLDRGLRFKAGKGTTFVLVPRDGGKPRLVQHEALMHFHINNAFEDGADTVMDLVVHDYTWDELNPRLRDGTDTRLYLGGGLERIRVTPSGRVLRERCCELPSEFPQHDWRRTGSPHRYGYLAARTGPTGLPNAVVKIDHQTRREQVHELPEGHVVSEPIFVPRRPDAGEDDGWLLTVAYDPGEHRSRLLVLDAQAPERDALAVAHLIHHVPFSFHGTFTPRVARPER